MIGEGGLVQWRGGGARGSRGERRERREVLVKVNGERGKEGRGGKDKVEGRTKSQQFRPFPSRTGKREERKGIPLSTNLISRKYFREKRLSIPFLFFFLFFYFCRSQSLSCLMSIGVSAFPRLPPAAASGVRRVSEPSPNLWDYSNSGLIITPREKARKKMRVKFQPWELFLNWGVFLLPFRSFLSSFFPPALLFARVQNCDVTLRHFRRWNEQSAQTFICSPDPARHQSARQIEGSPSFPSIFHHFSPPSLPPSLPLTFILEEIESWLNCNSVARFLPDSP